MNRYITILCLSIFLFSASPVLPQSHPNSLYVELLGNAGLYSFNYDRLFTHNIGARVGFSYLHTSEDIIFREMTFYLFPVSVNYFVGEGSSKLELGAGMTIISGSFDFIGIQGSGSAVIPNLIIGYRYQPEDGGLLFRIGFTPLFAPDKIQAWGGISLGAAF
jgi:hypothetical protein